MTLSSSGRRFQPKLVVSTLVILLACAVTLPARAQTSSHIVSSQALQQQLQTQSATRENNITTVTKFLSTPIAQRAMKMEHIDPMQVKKAIPTLSDSALANLSSRANQAQQQFAAGALTTNQMLLLIIVMLIVVLLVAVH
jgi:Tfp pilus assembly protein PilN